MRSDAQKQADKKYAETHKGQMVSWGTKFRSEEAERIDSVAKAHNMNRAELIRFAINELEKQN